MLCVENLSKRCLLFNGERDGEDCAEEEVDIFVIIDLYVP